MSSLSVANLPTPEPPRDEPPSWRPVAVADLVDAPYQPPQPTIGRRDDGHGVLYPGRAHSLVGESEGGKSWLAQLLCAQELGQDRGVLYLDFEDEAGAVVDRLLTVGADPTRVRERFGYISPAEPLTAPGATELLLQALGDLKPSLVIVDGVTEALSLHGLSTNDNDDVARFGRLLTRPITHTGAAVLTLDHVTKDREGRGRYAIGAVHKLNGLSGAQLILENVDRFGVGLAGKSRLLIGKDRPGQLRQHALPGAGDRWWYGDLTLDTTRLEDPAALVAPIAQTGPFRPTTLMRHVSDALAGAPIPLGTNDVCERVTGKATAVRKALACLVDEGYVEVVEGPRRSRLHTLTKPFEEDHP